MTLVNEEETQDLKEEEETLSEDGHSEENEEEETEEESEAEEQSDDSSEDPGESVESLKERLAKVEEERDNYKKGLLSRKAKERTLDLDEFEPEAPAAEEPEVKTQKDSKDSIEEKVQSVLYKERERGVLRQVIDKDSPYYIDELVDDKQYKDIIQYLPRRYDRTSEQGIVRGLKAAVAAWKTDKGIVDNKPKKTTKPLVSDRTGADGGNHQPQKSTIHNKFFKKPVEMKDWYKK